MNRGCEYGFVGYPFWVSSELNGAAKMRPDICPLGKYGYDARCRGWYVDGKQKALGGNGTLHITAPYVFAGGVQITGQSITAPIMQGGVHIGQTIIGAYSSFAPLKAMTRFSLSKTVSHLCVDFIPGEIFRSLAKETQKLGNGAFPLLITPDVDGKD